MSEDVHILAAPFRFIAGMFQALVVMVFGPLVLMGIVVYWLCTGNQVLSNDELSMLTAFFKIALITSIVWLPFMFIGRRIRIAGFYFLMVLALFFAIIQVDPHYIDHDLCLTMGQVGVMFFIPLAVSLIWHSSKFKRQPESMRVSETVRSNMIKNGLIPTDADEATTYKAWQKVLKSIPVMD